MQEEVITGSISGDIQLMEDDVLARTPDMDAAIEGNDTQSIKEIWTKIKEAIAKIDWEKVKEILDNNMLPGEGNLGAEEAHP